MSFDQLAADLERVAEVCNRFQHPDLQAAVFNILVTAIDAPPRPERLPYARPAPAHRADDATALIPAVTDY